MSHLLKVIAVAAFFASGASLGQRADATTPKDSPSKAETGAPDARPWQRPQAAGVGSSPIGPPATSSEHQQEESDRHVRRRRRARQNDPTRGGKKQ